MTLVAQGKNARKRSVWGHNTTTTTEIVYTCPANCVAELTYLHIHNKTGNTDIHIEWYISADNYSSSYLDGKNLGAGEFVSFNDIELVLQSGDRIEITPSSTAHVDSILTVTETFVPVG
jgi:hypothetical protein